MDLPQKITYTHTFTDIHTVIRMVAEDVAATTKRAAAAVMMKTDAAGEHVVMEDVAAMKEGSEDAHAVMMTIKSLISTSPATLLPKISQQRKSQDSRQCLVIWILMQKKTKKIQKKS